MYRGGGVLSRPDFLIANGCHSSSVDPDLVSGSPSTVADTFFSPVSRGVSASAESFWELTLTVDSRCIRKSALYSNIFLRSLRVHPTTMPCLVGWQLGSSVLRALPTLLVLVK